MIKASQMYGLRARRRAAAGGGALEFAYVSNAGANPASSSHTFSSQSIGAADANRLVIVGVFAGKNSGPWPSNPITTFTINGNAATIHTSQYLSGSRVALIGSYALTTGTTADIVISAGSAIRDVGIVVWRAANLVSNSANATAGGSSGQSLNIPSDGVAVGIAGVEASTSFTWTNMTERTDTSVGAAHTVSSADFQTAGTLTRSYAPGTGAVVGALASWA
jgi:hypothetical protein